jgi:hypothetical protein
LLQLNVFSQIPFNRSPRCSSSFGCGFAAL